MGSQIITRPLTQRLEAAGRKGILQSNSTENPFWVPEENPILRAWDMTLEEYCQTVRRATGQDLKGECGKAFSETWSELSETGWNISLVAILGDGYRVTHPDGEDDQPLWQDSNGENSLGYEPTVKPYKVHVRWENSALGTVGTPQEDDLLEWNLMKLVLRPFHTMEVRKRQKRGPKNGQKGR